MATYKIVNNLTDEIDNIILLDDPTSFDPGENFSIFEISESFVWDRIEIPNEVVPYAGGFVGSFFGDLSGTASYASNVPDIKSGFVDNSQPQMNGSGALIYSVIFSNHYSNTNYAVTITAEQDARIWTVENKETGSFVINSNSSSPLTGEVYWVAVPYKT